VPDDWLLEELIRRRNAEPVAKPKHWCHDCAHWKAWNEVPREGQMPDSFNPCTKGHTMQFVVPQEIDDEHGFYRHVCADREESP
jgi:hypothetical protein